MRACDEILEKTLDLVEAMMDLADRGDGAREDVGCGILYGVVRDSAYKIRRLAELERENHGKKRMVEGNAEHGGRMNHGDI